MFSKAILALVATAGLVACGGGGGSSSSGGGGGASTLTISGSISSSASGMSAMAAGDNASMAVSLTDLEVYAIAFTTPPVIDDAVVNADGTFTVELPGAKGSSVTAIFRDKTNKGEVGTIVFKDNSQKGLDGAAKESSSIVLSDNVQLGALTLGSDGKVVVDVATIATVVAAPPASSAAFDMSGIWKATAFAAPPTGYVTTCPSSVSQNDCDGLPENAEIALIRIAGKTFTKTTNCDIDADPVVCAEGDGTVGTTDRYAMSVWDASGVGACGHKTGFTEAEARAGGALHPTVALPTIGGTQVSFGPMTGYNPYHWVNSAATATRTIYDCQGINVTVNSKSVPAYACKGDILNGMSDTGSDGWMVNLGNGGCFDGSGKPVFVTDWSNTGANQIGSCSNDSTGLPTGFSKGSCNYNMDPDGSGTNYTAPVAFTCSWANGQFADASNAPNLSSPITTPNYRVGPPATKVAQNASCGNQANGSGVGLTLDEAKCYAEYYWQNQGSGPSCGSSPRFNHQATTVEDFYQVDFREKPKSQFLMDIITYDSSGTLATLDTEERESFTLASGSDSNVTCEVARRITFNLKKVTDTTAVVDIRFTGRIASTAAACQAVGKTAVENIAYNADKPQGQRRYAMQNADLEHMLKNNSIIMNLTKQ